MTRSLTTLSLLVGIAAGSIGACDCDTAPVDRAVCDFTVGARDGDTIDFGAVVENGGTRSGTLVVTNTGNVLLNDLQFAFSGNGDAYRVDVADDFSVSPSDDESVAVVFAPTRATALNAELTIAHPDPGTGGCPVRTITLRGEGVVAPLVDAGFPDAGVDAGVPDAGFEPDAGFLPLPDEGVELPPNARWRAYGGFEEARARFAAVPLPDGSVVVVGGYGENGTVLDSIERFDPTTGRSRVVAHMAQPRAEPGAVLLDDGRVAIVGGRTRREGGVIVKTIETYQPADDVVACPGVQAAGDGACSDNNLGALDEAARIGPLVTTTATGRIVVALGRTLDDDGNEIALAGGDVVDLATLATTPVAGLPARTDEARIAGTGGAFVVVGGRDAAGRAVSDVVRFDGAVATTLSVALPSPRAAAGAALLEDGAAIVVGGTGEGNAALDDAVVLRDVFGAADVAEPLPLALLPRVSPAVVALPGDIVLVAGGLPAGVRGVDVDDSVIPLSSAEVLVPFGAAGFARFAPGNELATGRFGGAAVVGEGGTSVAFVGGFAAAPRLTPHPHSERYLLDDNTFASFGLNGAGTALSAAALPTSGAALLSIGGVDPHTGVATARTRAFDAVNGVFLDASPLRSARRDHTATSIAADLIVVIGGRDATGQVLASASILDVDGVDVALPVTLQRARANHTATLLPDDAGLGGNAILVCGGEGDGGALLDTCEVLVAPSNPRDPSTFASASFTFVEGRMATGRVGHTATLLDGGEVLLAGGGDIESAQVAADVFVPTPTPQLVRTGVPVAARRHHAAVHLGAGRVLVVGGDVFDGTVGPTRGAELYVRGVGTFAALDDDMEEPRGKPAAFLLADGNVLIAGGTKPLGEPGFPSVSVIESELYTSGATGVGTFATVAVPLSYGRSDLLHVDVFGRAVVVGGTHRDGVTVTGDERQTPQHFVDVLEEAVP